MGVQANEITEQMEGCFDFKKREIVFRRSKITLLYLDTLCDTDYISQYIVEPLSQMRHDITDREDVSRAIYASNFGEVSDADAALEHILAGDPVLVFESIDYAIFFDAKKIRTRPIGKSQYASVLVGPKEGFNELLVDNVSVIRKRMATPKLKVEQHLLGKDSKTLTALMYVEGLAPDDLVRSVRKRMDSMQNIFVQGTQSISEALSPNNTFFDTIGYSERPDVVVSRLFEGRVAVIVNGSPFVLTAPCFFFEVLQAPDDYYSNLAGTNVMRLLRFFSLLVSFFLPGIYIALITSNYSLIPTDFVFKLAVSRSGVPFPAVVEVLLMFLFFELAREAGRRLPQQIGQSLSIVGALILGDAAVSAGLASQPTVVVTGVYAITSFINPRHTQAILAWAPVSVILSACFGLHGFYLSVILLIAHVASLRSCDYPYLFPFGTAKAFRRANNDVITRGRLRKVSRPFLYRGN